MLFVFIHGICSALPTLICVELVQNHEGSATAKVFENYCVCAMLGRGSATFIIANANLHSGICLASAGSAHVYLCLPRCTEEESLIQNRCCTVSHILAAGNFRPLFVILNVESKISCLKNMRCQNVIELSFSMWMGLCESVWSQHTSRKLLEMQISQQQPTDFEPKFVFLDQIGMDNHGHRSTFSRRKNVGR